MLIGSESCNVMADILLLKSFIYLLKYLLQLKYSNVGVPPHD